MRPLSPVPTVLTDVCALPSGIPLLPVVDASHIGACQIATAGSMRSWKLSIMIARAARATSFRPGIRALALLQGAPP
jgi:hypothetical protein